MKECTHKWAMVVAKYGEEIFSVPTARICLDCGILKVGTRTIRIANDRLDMGNKPINNASELHISSRLRIPVDHHIDVPHTDHSDVAYTDHGVPHSYHSDIAF